MCAAAAATLTLACVSPLHATALFWNPSLNSTANTGGAGNWDLMNTADWYNGSADQTWTDTAGLTDTANFAGTAGAVSLNSSLGALGLVFATTGYTISGSNTLSLGTAGIDAGTLTSGSTVLQNGTGAGVVALLANQTWNVGAGANLTVGASSNPTASTTAVVGGVTGAFSLTKSGAGSLTLASGASNTFNGGLTINAGTVSSPVSGGFGSGAITLNGGTLAITNQGNVGNFVGNNINAAAAAAITSTNKSNGYSGTLSGAGNLALTISGGGTFSPTGNMSAYTGTLTVASSSATTSNFRLANGFTGPTNGTVTLNANVALTNNSSTSTTITYTFGSLNTLAGSFISAGSPTGSGTIALSIGAANLNNTVASTITDGTTLKLGITKTGTGSLTLTGTNTNTGAINVNNGALVVSADANLGAVATPASVTLNGGGLVGNANFALDNAGANARGVTVTAVTGGTLAATSGNTMTVSGVVTGTGPLSIGTGNVSANGVATAGNGTVVLSAANNYSGVTTVNAGTLNINGVNALGGAFYAGTTFNGGTLQYAAGATGNGSLDISNIGGTPKPLTINAGGATIDTNGNNVTFANTIGNNGTGALTKTGAGVLTLTAANTFTGGTNVNVGTLAITANGALGSGSTTVAAGANLTLGIGVTAAHGNTGTTLTLAGITSTIELDGTGTQDTVAGLIIAGVPQLAGTYGAVGSGATFNLPEFTGSGVLLVTVPEPSTWAMLFFGLAGMGAMIMRRRVRA